MKKLFLLFFSLSLFFIPSFYFLKASSETNLYFFYGDGCPHCAKEEIFLDSIKIKYPDLIINRFEVYNSDQNLALFKKVAEILGVEALGVPFTVIGDKNFIGYADGITPNQIENRILECMENGCNDLIINIIDNNPVNKEIDEPQKKEEGAYKEDIIINNTEKSSDTLFGININSLSLPLLTIFMGVLDGFNPCAMWTLLFLISLLIGIRDRKRMWFLGMTFIVASALVYFTFMAAWLNLILFLGLIVWVKILIGIVALLGGSYNLKEFLSNKDSGCKVVNGEKREKVFEKIKKIISQNNLWFAFGGIIVLAFMVNLVELICSAGLPVIYTQILALNNLPIWQYYLYIVIYVFFFMIDDLFVFFVAMITLEMTGLTTKYVRYSRLIGGILMVLIGILLILKPDLLMFG